MAQYQFFSALLELLERTPAQAFDALARQKDQILEIVREHHRVDSFFLARIDLEQLQQIAEAHKTMQESLARVQAAATPQQLVEVVQELEKMIPGKAGREMAHLLSLLTGTDKEIEELQVLEALLVQLEQEMAIGNPLPRTAEVYREMKTALPKKLIAEFNDTALAKYLQEKLSEPDYHQPFPRPGPLRVLVTRILTRLRRGDFQEYRFNATKGPLLALLKKEVKMIERRQQNGVRRINNSLRRLMNSLENAMAKVQAAIHTQEEEAGLGGSLLAILAERIRMGEELLVKVNDGTATAQEVSLYGKWYLELTKSFAHQLDIIKGLERARIPREEMAGKTLERYAA